VAVAEPAQPAEPSLPAAEDGQDAPAAPAAPEFPPLEFELPSFDLPPLDSPSTASPVRSSPPASAPEAGSAVPPLPQEWSLDLEAAFPPLGTAARTSPSGQETPAVSDPAVASDADHEADPAPGSRRRGAFARMKSLVRGCLEEARDALHRFDAVELDDVEGEEEFLAATEEPEQQPRQPGQTALPEIPSFLAEGGAAPPSQGTGTAAPAPSALSDLRGWLPEPEDQLPRAS
jgi:hypothetical protein